MILQSEIANRLKGTVLDRPSVSDINKPISEYLYGVRIISSTYSFNTLKIYCNLSSPLTHPMHHCTLTLMEVYLFRVM